MLLAAEVRLGELAKEPEREPRRDDERDEEGEDHRGRGVHGDRAHVRPHQARHERERKKRRDDREGREDRRVADLVHGVDRREARLAPAELVVAVDVLDDDDRVVHEDADREDEGEERHAVQGVAEEIRREEREGERRGDRDEDDDRLAAPEEERHEDHDGERREAHVEDQLGRLLVGRLAVVARLRDRHVGGHDGPLEPLEADVELLHELDGVRAGLLRDGERHGGGVFPGLREHPRVLRGLLGPVRDGRDVAQPDGLAVRDADHGGADVLGAPEERADLDGHLRVAGREAARRKAPVEPRQSLMRLDERDAVGGEAVAVEDDVHDPALPAEDGHLRDARVPDELGLDLVGDLPELHRRRGLRPERVRGDRHVVDPARSDDGRQGAGREIRLELRELRVDAEDGLVGVRPDEEAHDHDPARGLRRRVDVLDVRDLVEGLLDGGDDAALDFRRPSRPGARRRRRSSGP